MLHPSGRRCGSVGARGHYGLVPLRCRDLPLLARWLHRPQVRAWWGRPIAELASIRRHRVSPWVACYVITCRGRPIGYLQCYDPAGDNFRILPIDRRGTRGIDLFIGEPAFLGKGHGAAVLRLVSDSLLARPEVRRVISDPDPGNRASLRAFEKAGFRDAGELDLPWGRARLLLRGQGSPGGVIRDQDAAAPLDAAIQAALRETATRVLASLTPREAEVLRARFGIGKDSNHSLEDLGRQFSVTRERIRRIEARALAKLCGPQDDGPDAA